MKLSIVTIHLNDFRGLERTLNSLQTLFGNTDVEWIVVDGKSDLQSDETDVLGNVRSMATHFVSEPDDGIYDAMNKGTLLATGDFTVYLNAGDELHPEFQYDRLAVQLVEGTGMIWGRYDVRDQTGRVYPRRARSPAWLRYGTAVCHQAIFFNRSLLGSEPYDKRLRIAADYDLICRLYTGGEKIRLLNMPVCVFDLEGESGKDKWSTLKEESKVRQKYFSVPGFLNGSITVFKLMIWQLGTLIPSFRRAWSKGS